MKTEKGERKLSVNRQSALFLTLGLVLVLFAAGAFSLGVKDCAELYFAFVAGIVGKDSAFVWGNSKEHAAAAAASAKPIQP